MQAWSNIGSVLTTVGQVLGVDDLKTYLSLTFVL
jgi:hypothetical protein